MKLEKVKVWWRKLDAEGNEIERGCDDREYINFGSARNRAEKLFGRGKHWELVGGEWVNVNSSPGIEWRIAPRDPWGEYSETVKCDICGSEFSLEINAYGHPRYWSYVNVKIDHERPTCYRPCPSCAEKVHNYVESLKKHDSFFPTDLL